jgi:hypothetical protein
LLVAAAVGYGSKRYYDKNKKRDNKNVDFN